MPVPGYQEFMLPLVKLAANGQEHKITDAIDALADQFGVSEQDREIMLPSGTQPVTSLCTASTPVSAPTSPFAWIAMRSRPTRSSSCAAV